MCPALPAGVRFVTADGCSIDCRVARASFLRNASASGESSEGTRLKDSAGLGAADPSSKPCSSTVDRWSNWRACFINEQGCSIISVTLGWREMTKTESSSQLQRGRATTVEIELDVHNVFYYRLHSRFVAVLTESSCSIGRRFHAKLPSTVAARLPTYARPDPWRRFCWELA